MLRGETTFKLILNVGAQKIVVNWVKKLNLAIFQGSKVAGINPKKMVRNGK